MATAVWDGETILTNHGAGSLGVDVTVSGKTTAGSDRIGVLTLTHYGAIGQTSGYPKWNGVSMTQAAGPVDDDYIGFRANIYYIVNPPTGASDVVFQFADNVTSYGYTISSYKDCDTSSPIEAVTTFGTTDIDNPSPISDSVSTSATSIVIDAGAFYYVDDLVIGAHQTLMRNTFHNIGIAVHFASYQAGADGGVMSWSHSGGNSAWSHALISIKGASGGAGSNSHRALLLGVGI